MREIRQSDAPADTMPFRLKMLLSAACCLTLANIYYAQPIIESIAADLGLDISMSGLSVSVTQAGYCLAVLFLVPLGDVIENKQFIVLLVVCAAVALALAALSKTPATFLAATFFIGMASCAVQVVIPMGIGLASGRERGSLAGMMMSGAILGISLARPAASWLTGMFGWRAAYIMGACLMSVLSIILLRYLPVKRGSAGRLSYPAIMRSMGTLFVSVHGLRPRLLIMFSVFFAFGMFWSTAPIYARDVLGFTHADIALFSLLSLVTPLCALFAGKMVDMGRGYRMAVIGMSMLAGAFLMTMGLETYAFFIVPVVLLLDPGTQMAIVVVHQSVLTLTFEARSRLNALCIGFNITGGAIGASLGPWLYSRLGWSSVAVAGALMVIFAFALNYYVKRGIPSKEIV